MHKKGQLTIFLLLGMVIVIAGAFLAYQHQQPSAEAPAIIPADTFTATEQMLHDCWQQAAERAVLKIGVYGGTLAPEIINEPSIFQAATTDGKITVPSASQLEQQLAYGTGRFARECENTVVQSAKRYGVSVELGTLEVKARVQPETVLFDFNCGHTLRNAKESKRVSPAALTIHSPIGTLAAYAYHIAQGVLLRHAIDVDSAVDAGINPTIYSGTHGVSAVILVKPEQAPNMTARWLVAFDQSQLIAALPQIEPLKPIVAPPDVQTLGVVQAIDPEGGILTYSSDSPLINIPDPQTGAFEVRPSALDVGVHPVVFDVTNDQGMTASVATEVNVQ